jgi:hypothetical protein
MRMAIKRGTSKGQLVAFTFMQDAVAASQTDVQLAVAEVASAAANGVDEIYMPFPGEVVAVAYDLSAAGSAGTLTVGATINGTEDADSTQTITTAQRGSGKVARGKAAFAAGAYLGAEITTDGSWNGTTADLVVTVWALVYLDGI